MKFQPHLYIACVVVLLTGCSPVLMGMTPADPSAIVTVAGSVPSTTLSVEKPILTLMGLYPVSLMGPKDTNRYPSEVVVDTTTRNGGTEKLLFHPKVEQGPDGVFHLKKGFLYAVVANVYMEMGGRLVKIRKGAVSFSSTGNYKIDDDPANAALPKKGTIWVYAVYKWNRSVSELGRLILEVVDSDGMVSNRVSVGPVVVDE